MQHAILFPNSFLLYDEVSLKDLSINQGRLYTVLRRVIIYVE